MIYLVKYIEDDSIEGYVETKAQFKLWLIARNIERQKENEVLESINEFELIEVNKL
jgi:hypothetical protein